MLNVCSFILFIGVYIFMFYVRFFSVYNLLHSLILSYYILLFCLLLLNLWKSVNVLDLKLEFWKHVHLILKLF